MFCSKLNKLGGKVNATILPQTSLQIGFYTFSHELDFLFVKLTFCDDIFNQLMKQSVGCEKGNLLKPGLSTSEIPQRSFIFLNKEPA